MTISNQRNNNTGRRKYALTGWFAFIQAFSVVFGVAGYFIWPYGYADAKTVFDGIRQSPLGYFMRLDPIVLIGTLLQMPVWFGLWSALRETDPEKSCAALALGMISSVTIIPARPLIELYDLSSLYQLSNSSEMRSVILSSASSLLSQFHGTSWLISIVSGGLAAVLFALVMRQSNRFRNMTFWTMLISGVGVQFVMIPAISTLALFFLGTIVGLIGTLYCGVDFIRLSRNIPESEA